MRRAFPVVARQPAARRDEGGLTTLAWLLMVAAVGSLAALAVVLVQRAVEDTAESVPLESRLAAAQLTAANIEDDARAAEAGDFATWADWERYFKGRCDRIAVVYSDSRITVTASTFARALGGTTFDATAAGYAAAADANPADPMKAQVACTVT